MSELKLELKGAGISPETADASEVLPVLVAYLDAVRRVAVAEADGDESRSPEFGLPRWYEGSAGAACVARRNEVGARAAIELVHRKLATPWELPRGVRASVSNLRDELRDLRDEVSVVVNGLADPIDITAIARGANRPTVFARESIRAEVERTGGAGRPSVRFKSAAEGTFTLRASAELAKAAGLKLYEAVDIEAEVFRASDLDEMPIMRGRLLELRPVSRGPLLEELRAWYAETHPEGVVIDDRE